MRQEGIGAALFSHLPARHRRAGSSVSTEMDLCLRVAHGAVLQDKAKRGPKGEGGCGAVLGVASVHLQELCCPGDCSEMPSQSRRKPGLFILCMKQSPGLCKPWGRDVPL